MDKKHRPQSTARELARKAIPHAALAERLKLLPALVEGVNCNDERKQLEAVTALRNLLSIERSPPIQEVIDCQVVPRLVFFMTCAHNHNLQFEAAWALTNIASGSSDDTKAVVDCGAVPLFIELLKSPNEDVREQAVWALGNIAGDGSVYRDLVLESGALRAIMCLNTPDATMEMRRLLTWTICNCSHGKPPLSRELASDVLSTLADLVVNSTHLEVGALMKISRLLENVHSREIQSAVSARLTPWLMGVLSRDRNITARRGMKLAPDPRRGHRRLARALSVGSVGAVPLNLEGNPTRSQLEMILRHHRDLVRDTVAHDETDLPAMFNGIDPESMNIGALGRVPLNIKFCRVAAPVDVHDTTRSEEQTHTVAFELARAENEKLVQKLTKISRNVDRVVEPIVHRLSTRHATARAILNNLTVDQLTRGVQIPVEYLRSDGFLYELKRSLERCNELEQLFVRVDSQGGGDRGRLALRTDRPIREHEFHDWDAPFLIDAGMIQPLLVPSRDRQSEEKSQYR